MSRIISFITNGTPWAIEQGALETILAIAQRENNLEAVLKERGAPLDNTRKVTARDGVAIIPVTGPLFPRANLFSDISGAYSVEMLALDLAAAESDPGIKSAVLMIDSPGGHTTMINEFANQVSAFSKPIVAYVVGQASSAAYWIASATDKITLDASAMVGSIGVVAAFSKSTGDTIEIVSSNAPDKRPDLTTDTGRSVVQTIVNDMEAVFISAVAYNRNMTVEQVSALRGGVAVGQKAINLGFADAIGSLESVIQNLQNEAVPMDLNTLKAEHKEIYQAAFAEGVTSANAEQANTDGRQAERTRIAAILNHTEAEGREAQAKALALETDLNTEQAVKVLTVTPKAVMQAEALNPFAAAMANVPNPNVGLGANEDNGDTSAADEVAKVVALFSGNKIGA